MRAWTNVVAGTGADRGAGYGSRCAVAGRLEDRGEGRPERRGGTGVGVRERTRQWQPSHDATDSAYTCLLSVSPLLTALTRIHVVCIAGCTLANVGSNSAGGSKAVTIGTTHTCPSTVSKANWLTSDTYSDTF